MTPFKQLDKCTLFKQGGLWYNWRAECLNRGGGRLNFFLNRLKGLIPF